MDHESDDDTIFFFVGTLCTVTQRFIKGWEDLEIRGREVTIETKDLLRWARKQRSVLETWRDSNGKSSVNARVKNSQKSKINH